MTPTKMSIVSSDCKVATDYKEKYEKRTSNRYSIYSDPRLSQLFALSSQLEALAETIEIESKAATAGLPTRSRPQSSHLSEEKSQIKKEVGNDLHERERLNGNTVSSKQETLCSSSSNKRDIQFIKLEEKGANDRPTASNPVDEMFHCDYDEMFSQLTEKHSRHSLPQVEAAGPPIRFSSMSLGSRMSTSSQGADSTPSANSVLSDSCTTMKAGFGVENDGSENYDETCQSWTDISKPKTESEWQARCIELELALQRFRDQAQNIRELLREKIIWLTANHLALAARSNSLTTQS